jgi:hypothetical protein
MKRIAFFVALCASCGGDDGGADPDVLRVAGEYPTQVMLESSTCEGIQVMSLPTSVRHDPGATTLSLVHAGSTYPGTIQRSGAFTTSPVPQVVGQDTHTLTMSGAFTVTGFTATVTVAVTRDLAPRCDYVVRWTATRQGGMNVIPG